MSQSQPLEAQQPFEVDDEYSSTSDYASSFESDSTSLLTAAKEHIYENGRRYHGWREGKYNIPNDEREQERMDILHHVMTMALDGALARAPIKEGLHRVLDLGTGTGIWVIDFADQYPSAEVTGLDLSPIQPSWVPPNAKFEVDDFEDEWTFRPDTFDYIHGRMLAAFVHNWEKLARQAFKATKPGGWIEMHDCGDPFLCDDDTVPKDSDHILRRWVRSWDEACDKAGCPWLGATNNHKMTKTLEDAGFVDVHEVHVKIPDNPWPKDKKQKAIGAYTQLHWEDGCESLSIGLFTRILGWSMEEVRKFLDELIPAFRDRKLHTYIDLVITYGRKPEKDE